MTARSKKTTGKPADSACSRCGASFECRKDDPPCWCAELPPVAKPVPGRGCLCRSCLEREGRKG